MLFMFRCILLVCLSLGIWWGTAEEAAGAITVPTSLTHIPSQNLVSAAVPGAIADYSQACLDSLQQGDHSGAITTCTQAIDLGQPQPDLYLLRGLALYRLGNFEAAAADDSRFLQQRPDDYRGYYNRGLALLAQEEVSLALADFDQALTLTADPAAQAEIYDDRGLARLLANAADAAMQDFSQAIALDPANVRAYFNRGCTCHHTGQIQAALKDFERVLTLDPAHASTYFRRAIVRQGSGDRFGAIADLQLAASHAYRQGDYTLRRHALNLLDKVQESISTVG
jgi:tetratricopeptide (TPR) repeat protein